MRRTWRCKIDDADVLCDNKMSATSRVTMNDATRCKTVSCPDVNIEVSSKMSHLRVCARSCQNARTRWSKANGKRSCVLTEEEHNQHHSLLCCLLFPPTSLLRFHPPHAGDTDQHASKLVQWSGKADVLIRHCQSVSGSTVGTSPSCGRGDLKCQSGAPTGSASECDSGAQVSRSWAKVEIQT